jgi:hypothetical protein
MTPDVMIVCIMTLNIMVECCHAECQFFCVSFILTFTNKPFMLSVTNKPFMLSVTNNPSVLSVTNKPFVLSVPMLSVFMLSVVVPN